MAFAPAHWPPRGPRRPWTSDALGEVRRPYTAEVPGIDVSVTLSAPSSARLPAESSTSAAPWPVAALEACHNASGRRHPWTRKQLRPVLSVRGEANIVDRMGAPAKVAGLANTSERSQPASRQEETKRSSHQSSVASSRSSWTPKVVRPRQARIRQRHQVSVQRSEDDFETDSSSSDSSSNPRSSEKSSMRPAQEAQRPISPLTLYQVLHMRSLGKPVSQRTAALQEALAKHDKERELFARHRGDILKAASKYNREDAARWRESRIREQQLCELRWRFQDSNFAASIARDDLADPERLVTTPVPEERPEEDEDNDKDDGELTPRPDARLNKLSPEVTKEVKAAEMLRNARHKSTLKQRLHRLHGRVAQRKSQPSETKSSEQDKDARSENQRDTSEGAQVEDEEPRKNSLSKSFRPRATVTVQVDVDELDQETPSQESDSKSNMSKTVANFRKNVTGVMMQSGRKSIAGLGGRFKIGIADVVTKAQCIASEGASAKLHLDSGAFQATAKDNVVLMQVFSKYDKSSQGYLDQMQLLECLDCLGLRAKNDRERAEVRSIMWSVDNLTYNFDDFSKDITPRVRKMLADLRRPRLVELFRSIDVYNRGTLSIVETLDSLRLQGLIVGEALVDEALRTYAQHAGRPEKLFIRRLATIDEESFVGIVILLQEFQAREHFEKFARVADRFNLSMEMQEIWRHDLVRLHAQFYVNVPSSGCWGNPSGKLNESELFTVLRESGYMPKSPPKQKEVKKLVQQVMGNSGTVDFMGFLKIIHFMREVEKDRLRRAVDLIAGKNCVVLASDVGHLLRDCSVITKAMADRQDVKEVLEEGDGRGTQFLGREEVVTICLRLHELQRLITLERERQYVLQAEGWDESHFVEFRRAFHYFDEDMSEVLERDELLLAMDKLRGKVWRDTSNVNLMLAALGLDPHKEIKVNFLYFLRMLKLLDEIGLRREQGAAMDFGRDRTDSLFSAFQALEPESNATVQRQTLETAMRKAIGKWCTYPQFSDACKVLGDSTAPVTFQAFLRVLKGIEAVVEGDFEECLDDIERWENTLEDDEGITNDLGSMFSGLFGSSGTTTFDDVADEPVEPSAPLTCALPSPMRR